MTEQAREFVILFKLCNRNVEPNDCLSEVDAMSWLQSKNILLLWNERFLNREDEESTADLAKEIYDLFDLDGAYSVNRRSDVVEKSHAHLIKFNTI